MTKEIPWLVAVTGLMVLLAWVPPQVTVGNVTGHGFGRPHGIFMLLLFLGMTWQWYTAGRREMRDPLTAEVEEEVEEDARPGRCGSASRCCWSASRCWWPAVSWPSRARSALPRRSVSARR